MPAYTLEQIKAHPSFPFADYATNNLSFLLLELYWAQLFAEVMAEALEDWVPIEDAELDGNPILSVASMSHLRALRVIHKVNEESKPVYPATKGEGTFYSLQAWLNEGRTPDGATVLNELVLFAEPAHETEKEASRFIHLHCLEMADSEALERAIGEYESRVGMPD